MSSKNTLPHYLFTVLSIALLSIAVMPIATLLSACGKSSTSANHEQTGITGHAEKEATEFERGLHNGRLLRDGDFSVEITIFEQGVPPEFRIYGFEKNKPIKPADLKLSVELLRFAGVIDKLSFAAKDDYLVSTAEVYEPHSFDVTVAAQYQGKSHRWTYASYEGRTTINAAAATAGGIQTAAVGAGDIEERISLYGTIQPDATRVRSVVARFPGVIRTVDVAVGDAVRAGQTLATVESNESLQTYAVIAPIAGTVIQRHANHGEATAAEPLFEIADYSQVWALLNVFPRDRARIQTDQAVAIRAADGAANSHGTIAAMNVGASSAPSISARIVLDNRSGQWAPGQFVNAEATIAKTKVALVLPVSALQTFRDWNVVFLNVGETYQAQPVQLGKRDGNNIEITSGLTAGMSVVIANSYLVKADIEKTGASHDH